MEVVCSLLKETPLSEEVAQFYDDTKERIQDANYRNDLAIRHLKKAI